MIKIEALNKIYRSKKRKKCHALKNVNLTLADEGLVFVLGKSGSGKSTLLNLIGGLDSITDGKIEVDGNNLAELNEKEFCNYRNTHIGFVFQDYHLIDELTVYDNIALSLDLRRIEDGGKIKEALEKVDLAGYEDRYPHELSGGEQQRVAIARAIVKAPRIILADEPTGNLDTNTAQAIIKILKELSKECLILIVSHNINDAYNYADRIIELKKGEIIDDKSRNPDFADRITIKDDVLIYPEDASLSDSDIDIINENSNKKLIKRTDKYIKTKSIKAEGNVVKIENKGLSFSKELKLFGKFFKKQTFRISLSAFIAAVIMVIMALSQTIINFNASAIIVSEMDKTGQKTLLLGKGVKDSTASLLEREYRVKVTDEDIQAFYDAGYEGKIYPVLNYSIPIKSSGMFYGTGKTHFTNTVYITETLGTLLVDEEFLAKKFGEIRYDARVDEFKPYGVFITDYVADSIRLGNSKYNGKSYADIVGKYYTSSLTTEIVYINGVIDTRYEDRYKDLFERLGKIKNITISDLYEDKGFQELSNEIYDRLGYSYATSPNFVESLLSTPLGNYPNHYKLNFNGVMDFTTVNNTYVLPYAQNKNGNAYECDLKLGWLYTQDIPEIPKGAKYIRVAFNDQIDDMYKIANEITWWESAKLSFNGKPVSKELMNAGKSTSEEGIALDVYSGDVISTGSVGKGATYVSDYIRIPEGAKITEFSAITQRLYAFYAFYDENKQFISAEQALGDKLPDNCIRMSYTKYNSLFGTQYTVNDLDTFVPHKVTLSHYEYVDVENSSPLFTREVTIVGLNTASATLQVSQNIYELFKKDFIRPYSLYFDGVKGVDTVLDTADKLNYEPQSVAIEGIHTMTKAVEVFVPIFELVAIFLCLGVIFILINFSTKAINDKMHEIGIMKALGAKNGTVGVVFGLQVALIALLTCFMSVAGYFIFIGVANDVLVESLQQLAPFHVVLDLEFLTFQPIVAMVNCLLVVFLAAVSLVAPMLKIKAIKPVKIIKTKDQ